MRKNNLTLSIIVPIYNAYQYLERCINSILNQGLDENDYEILLINDGSTDNSLKICNHYSTIKPSLIKIINKPNEGVVVTRNCGIDYAKGEYIYFIDADDYLIPNGLNYLITNFLHEEIDILSFWSLTLDKKTKKTFHENNNIKGKICLECKGHNFLYDNVQTFVTTSIYKKDFLKRHQLYFNQIPIGEDILFNLKVYLKNPSVRVVSSRLYRYCLHNESIIHRRDSGFMKESIKAYMSLFTFIREQIDIYEKIDLRLSYGLRRILEAQFPPFTSRVLSSNLSVKEIRLLKGNLVKNGILPLKLGNKYNGVINFIFKHYYICPVLRFLYQKIFITFIFPFVSRN